jgi:serine/threonine-protein kinase
VLRPELAATVGPDRFLREIRTTARLQHPHILPMLDSARPPGSSGIPCPTCAGRVCATVSGGRCSYRWTAR